MTVAAKLNNDDVDEASEVVYSDEVAKRDDYKDGEDSSEVVCSDETGATFFNPNFDDDEEDSDFPSMQFLTLDFCPDKSGFTFFNPNTPRRQPEACVSVLCIMHLKMD